MAENESISRLFTKLCLKPGPLASSGSSGIGKGGRKLSHTAKVQGNGNLLVGKAYTAMLDLNPGDEFTIKLGKKVIASSLLATAMKRNQGKRTPASYNKVPLIL